MERTGNNPEGAKDVPVYTGTQMAECSSAEMDKPKEEPCTELLPQELVENPLLLANEGLDLEKFRKYLAECRKMELGNVSEATEQSSAAAVETTVTSPTTSDPVEQPTCSYVYNPANSIAIRFYRPTVPSAPTDSIALQPYHTVTVKEYLIVPEPPNPAQGTESTYYENVQDWLQKSFLAKLCMLHELANVQFNIFYYNMVESEDERHKNIVREGPERFQKIALDIMDIHGRIKNVVKAAGGQFEAYISKPKSISQNNGNMPIVEPFIKDAVDNLCAKFAQLPSSYNNSEADKLFEETITCVNTRLEYLKQYESYLLYRIESLFELCVREPE